MDDDVVLLPWPDHIKTGERIEYAWTDSKGETHVEFEEQNALAALLLSGVVFLNEFHWRDDWPADARKATALCVNTNDVFAWGCADAEDMLYRDIPDVYRHWIKDPCWGAAIWAMIKTRQMPQKPVEKSMRAGGIWDIDVLKAEHKLRANHYDGISGVLAGMKRKVYIAWCEETGQSPLPFDGAWWKGWDAYTAAHPTWNDAEWKAREATAMSQWKDENGWNTDK